MNCPPGQHPNRDSTGCVPCPEGTYKPDFGPKTCTICSKNKTTAEDGATDSTQCISMLTATVFIVRTNLEKLKMCKSDKWCGD